MFHYSLLKLEYENRFQLIIHLFFINVNKKSNIFKINVIYIIVNKSKGEIKRMTIDEKNQKTVHNVIMENRKSLTISGVTDVDSFDERCISLYTQMGELVIRGRDLHINSMSVETGDMTIDGDIWALNYGDKDKRGTVSLLGKLFR